MSVRRSARARLAAACAAALVVLGVATQARGDELRLADGEILFGRIVREDERTLEVETAAGTRRIPVGVVTERIPGEDPRDALARARDPARAAGTATALSDLAVFAWRHFLDADAAELAREALALDPGDEGTRRVLGCLAGGDGAAAAWPRPFPDPAAAGRHGATRQRLARPHGGARAEAALAAALDWLARHQASDGRLDADGFAERCPEDDRCDGAGGGHHGERVPSAFDGAVTGLAVLAWLGAGSTPVSGPRREAVARGLAFLERLLASGRGGFDDVWNRSFALQALADSLLLVREPERLALVARQAELLLEEQKPDGGWSYVFSVGDVPTTGVVLHALGVAIQAGVRVPAAPIERALAFLDARVDRETGRSEYHDGAEAKGYTPTRANAAAALSARAFLGRLDGTPDLSRQLAAVRDQDPRWKVSFREVKTQDGRTVRAQVGDLYPWAWFLTTLALQQRGGSAFAAWQRAVVAALLDGQRRDGHAAGSLDPLGTYSSSGGRVFTTALAALMIEAPYRYAGAR